MDGVGIVIEVTKVVIAQLEAMQVMKDRKKNLKFVVGRIAKLLPKMDKDLMIQVEQELEELKGLLEKIVDGGEFTGKLDNKRKKKKGPLNKSVLFVKQYWSAQKRRSKLDEHDKNLFRLVQLIPAEELLKGKPTNEEVNKQDEDADAKALATHLNKLKSNKEYVKLVKPVLERLVDQDSNGFKNNMDLLTAQILANEMHDEADIDRSELELFEDEILGEGRFGVVIFGKYKRKKCAAKLVRVVGQLGSIEAQQALLSESRLWAKLGTHKNISKLYGTCMVDCTLHFVSEFCDTSLDKVIKHQEGHFTLDEVETVMIGIARGLEFIHSQGIIHRNVKPQNILLSHDLGKIKLTDFGLATEHNSLETIAGHTNGVKGTWNYMAPETLKHPAKWSFRADIYAFGIVFWEILHLGISYGHAFSSQAEALHVVVDELSRPVISEDREIKKWYEKMLEDCWSGNLKQRPTASVILQTLQTKSPSRQRRSTRIVQKITSTFKRHSIPKKTSNLDELEVTMEELKKNFNVGALKRLGEMISSDKKLAKDDDEELREKRKRVWNSGVSSKILEEMSQNRKEVELQTHGLIVIQFVGRGTGDTFQIISTNLFQMGVASVILSVMDAHVDNAVVQENACDALTSLAFDSDKKIPLMKQGAAAALLRAMDAHVDNADAQNYACGALRNLAVNSDNKITLMKQGAAAAILRAMDAHVDNADVQRSACGALWDLAANCDNMTTLMKQGAAAAILRAMDAHVDNADVQRRGCGALWNLAANSDNQIKLFEDIKAYEQILRALQKHPRNKAVQEEGFRAMKKLCWAWFDHS